MLRIWIQLFFYTEQDPDAALDLSTEPGFFLALSDNLNNFVLQRVNR